MAKISVQQEDAYYGRVAAGKLFPLWKMPPQQSEPKPRAVPYVWRWDSVVDLLDEAGRMNHTIDQGGERRALIMINPGFEGPFAGTTPSIAAAMQMIKPGEVANAHRHSMAAIRFILRGSGATTVVNGEKVTMEEGDLVLTPQMVWHDHTNPMAQDLYWLDALDAPLVFHLNANFYNFYYEDVQPETVPENHTADTLGRGLLRNQYAPSRERSLSLIYKWKDAHAALQSATDSETSPFDGIIFEYTNPLDAGHTLPAMSCFIQRLRPGEHTEAHRHTASVVYHAFQGQGSTVINSQRLDWARGDTFVLPSWAWHEHVNASESEEAVLFSVSDLPVIEAMDLYKVEEGSRQEITGVVESSV